MIFRSSFFFFFTSNKLITACQKEFHLEITNELHYRTMFNIGLICHCNTGLESWKDCLVVFFPKAKTKLDNLLIIMTKLVIGKKMGITVSLLKKI